MSQYRSEIVQRMETCGLPLDPRVFETLHDPATRIVGDTRGGGTTQYILGIWRLRRDINIGTDHEAIGADDLIRVLEQRPCQRKIEQASFSGTHYSCVLFFDWSTKAFLGYFMIRRRSPSEEQARIRRFQIATGQTAVEAEVSNYASRELLQSA